jgi:hypothetical protein
VSVAEWPETKRILASEVVLDGRTSPICLRLAGVILPLEELEKRRWIPPLHFRCRTALVTYSSDAAARRGITRQIPEVEPLEGFGQPPTARDWTPDPNKYDPVLWAAYQRMQVGGLPRASADDRDPFQGRLETVLTNEETASITSVVTQAGLGAFLDAHPMELSLQPSVQFRGRDVAGVYDFWNRRAEVATTRNDPSQPFRSRATESVSSTGATPLERVRRTLIHEIGHHVHWLLRELHPDLFRRSILLPRSDAITTYATSDELEYFAESFAAFVFLRTELIVQDRLAYAMIEETLVRLGVEVNEL